jgi:hypothetical protein
MARITQVEVSQVDLAPKLKRTDAIQAFITRGDRDAAQSEPETVRNHHYVIKAKIGARNDAQLVWIAARTDLVQIDVAGPASSED